MKNSARCRLQASAGLAQAGHQAGLLAAAGFFLSLCSSSCSVSETCRRRLAATSAAPAGNASACSPSRPGCACPCAARRSGRDAPADRRRRRSRPPPAAGGPPTGDRCDPRASPIGLPARRALRGRRAGQASRLAVVAGALPEVRPADAGRAMAADDAAVRVLALDVVDEDVLGGDDVALGADHLGDVGDAARAVAQARGLDDDVDRGRRSSRAASSSGSVKPPMVIIDSRRDSASRGLLAWSVPIEPSWPVFIACRRSKASGPRTSPTMIRSGRMRRQFLTRSRMVISPSPSMLGGRVSRRTTCGCCSCSSAASSQVMMRSSCLDVAGEAVEQRRLARAGAAGDEHVAARAADDLRGRRRLPGEMVPYLTS